MPTHILMTAARLLIASLFLVISGERLLIGFGVLDAVSHFSSGVLVISGLEMLAGLLIAVGWQLRWLAGFMALLMLADAIGSHPFWVADSASMHNQLLHFAKNMAIIGGCLLLVGVDINQNPKDLRA